MTKTTKQIIEECKRAIKERYQNYMQLPDAIQYAKCRTDIDQILLRHLVLYVKRCPEMHALITWLEKFKDTTLSENMECLENHVLLSSANADKKSMH